MPLRTITLSNENKNSKNNKAGEACKIIKNALKVRQLSFLNVKICFHLRLALRSNEIQSEDYSQSGCKFG